MLNYECSLARLSPVFLSPTLSSSLFILLQLVDERLVMIRIGQVSVCCEQLLRFVKYIFS